ncbi:MAG: diguanylate cyclase [Planctomycetota bacterium]
MTAKKILVVEDSPTQAQVVRVVLERAGYEVLLAADGVQGLEIFGSAAPDLVLLDVNLPRKNGFEVCAEIKKAETEDFTPIIMLTEKTDLDSRVKGLTLGADDYLPKPFDAAELQARVRAMLRIKEAEDRVRRLSVTDELTELYNRRFLMKRLSEELAHAERHNVGVGCVLLDIDHFKQVNDSYGHQFGDTVLRGVAKLIRGCAREEDVAARYGGEEFVLVLRNTDARAAEIVAERLRTKIAETVFHHDREEVRLTVCCGVASFPDTVSQCSVDSLLRGADSALYLGKRQGRNRTEVYRSSIEL